MAAYYHGGAGTDIHQAGSDGLQTLYLMNPSYGAGGFGDAAPSGSNMVFLNSAVSSMTPASFGGHQASPSSGQHFVGIPLQAPPSGYNLWTPATTRGADVMSPPTHQAHGVSAVLSLSSRETPPVTVASVAGDEGRYQLGVTTAASQGQMVMNSKYLRAAQELLDEVVSVSKGVDDVDAKAASAAKSAASVRKKEDSEGLSGGGGEDGAGGSKSTGAPEMSTAERQELQMKKGKLVNMLDEVEQRYRQYHQQMASVSSSFEAVAGAGSARTYTSLALRTISRQFRCLRDAIASQVRAACRALGEEDADVGAGGGRGVGSRLRYIDHQLRQQRALQQLGMMQSSAWRPQRGLPERSVSILRAWLFEHFLHPYPKDSDKIMLAKQTGLTRSQVSNWFINARVRLWKPMVEEMYLEETKEKQEGGNGDDAVRSGPGGKADVNDGADDTPRSMVRAAAGGTEAGGSSKLDSGAVHASLLDLTGDHRVQMGFYDDDGDDHEDGGGLRRGFKKARAADVDQQQQHQPPPSYDVAALHHAQAAAAAAARQQHEEVSHRELLMKFMESGAGARDHHQQDDVDGGGGAYSLFAPGPYGQFGSDQAPYAFAGQHGGVSLTLGLPHGAGDQTASFLMGGGSSNGADTSGAAAGYDMNMQTTKSFAAQLMRDFVA